MTSSISQPHQNSADRLWTFALAVYQCDGVAPACLALQDNCDADIPLLLATGFAAWQAKIVDAAAITRLQQLSTPWQHDIVKALRQIRRQLKAGPHPAPNEASEALRQTIKNAELAAEQIQLNMLAATIDDLGSSGKNADLAGIRDALTMIITAKTNTIAQDQHRQISLIAAAMLAQTR